MWRMWLLLEKIAMRSRVVRGLMLDAWHDGWEQRSMLGGPPACPSDYPKFWMEKDD